MGSKELRNIAAIGTGIAGTGIYEVWENTYYSALHAVQEVNKDAVAGMKWPNTSYWFFPTVDTYSLPQTKPPVNLSPMENFVNNVVAHPVFEISAKILVPAVLWGIPIVYELNKYRKLGKDAEFAETRNNVAEKHSRMHFNDYFGNDSEEKRTEAFLDACSVLDRNRKKIRSEEDAETFLSQHYQTLGPTVAYEKEPRLPIISNAFYKIQNKLNRIKIK